MTPAIKLAQKQNVAHTVHSYEHDSNSLSYGDEARQKLAVDANRVFKTLIVELSTGALAVGVVPVNGKLNLKAMANALGAKKAHMADTDKAQRSTGYLLGGISPIAQKKALKTVIHCSAQDLGTVFVSAGRRGVEIELHAACLAKLCKAQFAQIASI